MNKQEILDEIYKYIGNDNAKYAIMITGEWGSGKTYLYDDFLEEKINKVITGKGEKTVSAYISLYGIKTVEQLSKELLTNFILKAQLHADDTKGKIYKVASGMVGVVSKAFSLSISAGGVDTSVDFSKIVEGICEKINIKRMFICMDDLERCSIPINELFGFINNLVEHCECKVLLLADEENIGKMYANSNIEMKYNTLLVGRKLVERLENDANQNQEEKYESITIDALKKLNEKVYSENYIYKDIKEKVIGLTMKYTPDLKEDMDDIIASIVNEGVYKNYLTANKDKIIEYMLKCDNNNVRIVRNWIIKFEQIYNVVNKHFAGLKYYADVVNKFMVYSIRIACAIGKNKKLMKWTGDAEFSTVRLEDGFLFHADGYRFIDDLYLNSLFDEERINKAVRYIESQYIEMEEKREEDSKKYSSGVMLGNLNRWEIYEDAEIFEFIVSLKDELEDGKYVPQNYQHIIGKLVELYAEGLCEEDDIKQLKEIMLKKVKEINSEIRIENFISNFANDDICTMFHKYYDPVYEKIVSKNKNIGEEELNISINVNNPDQFMDYCEKNRLLFTEMKGFMRFINLEKFMQCIENIKLENVYEVVAEIEKVYSFYDVRQHYLKDIASLKELKSKIEKLENEERGITRKKAYKYFVNSISTIIQKLGN